MTLLNLAVQSYPAISPAVSTERIVNAYAEQQPKSARSPVTINGSPGVVTFATVGDGPIRAGIVMGGLLYVISGTRLYSVSENGGTVIKVGAGIIGEAPLSIAQNGTEICIVNGTTGWTYDTTNELRTISDGDFYGANTVTFLDSFFVFDRAGTNRIFHSNLLDGQTYVSNNIASAESFPDNVVGVWNHGNRLYVFGEETIEFWYDAGALDFPFRVIDGGTITYGCISPLSISEIDNKLYFMGRERIAYQLDGIIPTRISTHAIEARWESYDTIADAEATTYYFSGHKFISFKFPGANETWVYDASTQLWHERESLQDNGSTKRWRGNTSFEAYGKTFIGDEETGKIGTLSSTDYTEWGDGTTMTLVNPPVADADGRRLFMPLFELEIEKGVGLDDGQGSDPQILMDYSDDRGHNYTPRQRWKSMGKRGVYGGIPLRWDRLGQFYSRVIRLKISDPVRRTIIAARAPGMYRGTS